MSSKTASPRRKRLGRYLWRAAIIGALALLVATSVSHGLTATLLKNYDMLASPVTSDRNGEIIRVHPNARGYYARYADAVPSRFATLLSRVEDRYFMRHMGINPMSILRSGITLVRTGQWEGSSTITQQLTKILLGNERERTFGNKLREAAYALALELTLPKDDILAMYADVVYFGNLAQGIEEASLYYFDRPPGVLTDEEYLELVATLRSPSAGYPGTRENRTLVDRLAATLNIATLVEQAATNSPPILHRTSTTNFEVETLGISCEESCRLTIDRELTETLREILGRNLRSPVFDSAFNGAIVVIKVPENELLAIVGSPNPSAEAFGYRINMALKPRAIGSTAKPFIYVKGFEKGLRPYTLVDDREYKYLIGSGYSLYPKNYDYEYRGILTLHYALANSLNVPTVKVLEFVGIEEFNRFLTESLAFTPLQALENYELGIALGVLEMDLLTLTHAFSIFPNGGLLKPLTVVLEGTGERTLPPPMSQLREERRVAEESYVALVNRILTDRQTGVEQFGLKSNLNLPYENYAVKTGTSRDFHDSWTIGYTPDLLVGVWVGNADETPLEGISGQSGAGAIWHEVMELLLNSPYSAATPFDLSRVHTFTQGGTLEYGLAGDSYSEIRNVLLDQSRALILEPHHGDVILLNNAEITLIAKRSVVWSVNGEPIGQGLRSLWTPTAPGVYTISARADAGTKETVTVEIRAEEE